MANTAVRGTETILVVEDEDDLRSLVEEWLGEFGYTVLAAATGDDAPRIDAERGPAEAVITDVVMPRMGGLELATRLTARRPALNILYMSGYTDDRATLREALKPGRAYLKKPFKLPELSRQLRALLDAAS